MKKLIKAIAALMLMTAVVCVVGCKKTDDPNGGGNEINEESINPNYVPIDWTQATLLSANDSIGDYQIQFNGEMPELHPGSIISIDQDTVVHHIFIRTVEVDGNTASITSIEAYLTDIFANTGFTLSTVDENRSSAHGKVYYPVAIFQCDELGNYREIDLNSIRGERVGFTHDLWQYGQNFDGEVLFSGDHYSIYMEKLNFDFDLDLVMDMNFSGRDDLEIIDDAIERWMSHALEVNAYLKGTYNAEEKIRCDIEGSCGYSPGSRIWKRNLFPIVYLKFYASGVPVLIRFSSDLYREVELTASGKISAYTGYAENAEGRFGFKWSQANGMDTLASFQETFEFTPPTVEGRGTIEAKAWAYPRVNLLLYGLLGPAFDLKPYISITLSGGFKEQMLGQSNDYCAWSLDCNTGLDGACSLSRRFLGVLDNPPSVKRNIVNKPLYHSPKRIDHSSKQANQSERRTVVFNVYDQNYLFNTEVLTHLPQIVKFEANGELSSEYGIANGGKVMVDWTPVENDILYAKLYDIEGNVVAWDTVHASTEQGDWVDLGLPSGLLWATRNVGASSPTDYGGYYAWAETSPKSYYDWESYRYFRCDDNDCGFTKYCNDVTDGYGGYTDDLTVLQIVDDAATINYGGRMPTKEEWQELFNNTTSQWMTVDGVNGLRLTGPNGFSLFLPATGRRDGNDIYDVGSEGYYWSSSFCLDDSYYGWHSSFDADDHEMDYNDRVLGQSVRAVRVTK